MAIVGALKIPLRKVPITGKQQYFVVVGGPFMECPKEFVGVKMAAEVNKRCVVDIPTQDFKTPDKKQLYRGLHTALNRMLAGEPLYVGCMAGKGRTGLFLAVLCKTFGIEKPVEYVRANYYPRAVETNEQYQYVMKFKITKALKRKMTKARRWSCLKFWRENLTNMPDMPAEFWATPKECVEVADKLAPKKGLVDRLLTGPDGVETRS